MTTAVNLTVEPGYKHISRREDGDLLVTGTRFKLVPLIGWHLSEGWDAKELAQQFSPLTLGQAHAVLGYYYDNREAVDELRAQWDRDYEEARKQWPDSESVIRKKLRAKASQ